MRWLVLAGLLLVCAPIFGDTGASVMPEKSALAIGDTLGRARELLWEKTDGFFHQGDYERAIANLKLISEVDPGDVDAYIMAAWLMESKEREAEGIEFIKLGASRNPKNWKLPAELGRMYFDNEDFTTAAAYYKTALELPDCPEILWHRLAHAYEHAGQLEKSVSAWEHALSLEPGDGTVLLNLERVKKKLAEREGR